jgi:ABC-2 type transport system ATP-binding protein
VRGLATVAVVGRRRIGRFSLGMRQRLGIAAALLGDPPVLLFDEPFNGLDPEGVLWVRRLFHRLATQGRTVLVSSHLMSEMEHTAEQLIVIGRGELIAQESLKDFAARSGRPSVTVRTPDAAALAEVLVAGGAVVRLDGAGAINVVGLSAEEIGELASTHGMRLFGLSDHQPSLEDAFMQLTADKVEYQAGDLR